MNKVFKLIVGNFVNMSRDIRELTALANNGYDVLVCSMDEKEEKLDKSDLFQVKAVNLPPKKSNGFIRKTLRFLSYTKQCRIMIKAYEPDIISARNLPALAVGSLINKTLKHKCKLLYDSHELTSEVYNLRVSKFKKIGITLLEGFFIKRADAVMVVCDTIALIDQKKYSLSKKPYVIRNLPYFKSNNETNNLFRDKFNLKSKKILLYQGGIQEGRGIENIIEMMRYLDDNYTLILMGYGDIEKYINLTYKKNVADKVFYHEAVGYDVLLKYTSSADIGIHFIENSCLNHYYCLPNKIFEYIQAGIPVLCSDFPEISQIVNGYQIGMTVNPQDAEIAALKVKQMINQNQYKEYKNNMPKAQQELCFENESIKLLKMYSDIVENKIKG